MPRIYTLLAIAALGCGARFDEENKAQDSGIGPPRDGDPCGVVGARACNGVGQRQRLECDGQRWRISGECAIDEVCDPRDGASLGTCQIALCAIGEVRCTGSRLASCHPHRLEWSTSECMSEEHCKQAVGGLCARCLAWEARCEGATLNKCGGDRQGLVAIETCASAALCDAVAGACRSPVCADGDRRCNGDVLETCSSGRNAFEKVEVCAAGRCDAALLRCRDCEAPQRDCLGSTPRECDAKGAWVPQTPCSDATPICRDGACVSGLCVPGEWRCLGDTLQRCDKTASGFVDVLKCAAGLCDPSGECDECTPGARTCVGLTPRTCDATGHWSSGASCAGATAVCRDGACRATYCDSAEHRCTADTLERCNASLTAFEKVADCDAGLCDSVGKECDACKSGARRCNAGAPETCDSVGHWTAGTLCTAGTKCFAGACATPTTYTFPIGTAVTWNAASGEFGTLGSGGGGVHFKSGSYVEQAIIHGAAINGLELNVRMSDLTTTSCAVGSLGWAVKLNGTIVGTYSWVGGGSGGDKIVADSYSFPAVSPVGGKFVVRLEATSTVCSLGGAWNWYPAGTIVVY
jgi:hypothetical protein